MKSAQTDFEKRIEQERAKAKEQRKRLAGIIQHIGFTPETENGEESSRAYVRGSRADGAKCTMETDTYGLKGRISFTAWTPRPDDGTHVKTPDQITMSATKTDAQIVADIKKRYLPNFEPCMIEFRTRYDKARSCERMQDVLIGGCADLLGFQRPEEGRPGRERPRLYEYTDCEHVRKIQIETDYYGTEARIELDVSPEAAMLLCAKIGEWLKEKKA